MNSQAIAQVASFLNVAPNQIKRCEEWASVIFVVVCGSRPRFISKKVIKVEKMNYSAMALAQHGWVAVINGNHPVYTYDRTFVGAKTKASRKYHKLEATLVPGKVYEFRGCFEGNKERVGFYEVVNGSLVAVPEGQEFKYASKVSYPHEIYEELANPTTYAG